MTRPAIGVVAGGVLGFIDGMSAWFYPEARSMMLTIILGSTIKGILTGLSVGFVANRKQSLPLGIVAGALVGFVLSSLVAMSQPAGRRDLWGHLSAMAGGRCRAVLRFGYFKSGWSISSAYIQIERCPATRRQMARHVRGATWNRHADA
jgi:hypothetical protein